MPELDYLLAETPCEPYPYRYSWDEAKDHPCVVVQSSRSSGPPKAVVWPHSVLVTTDMYHLVRPYEGREVLWGSVFGSSRRVFTATPVFHGHGIVASLGRTLFTNSTVVLGPPGQCTTDVFAQVLEHGRIDSAICLGSLLEEVATKPDLLAKVGLLKHIAYVGGIVYPLIFLTRANMNRSPGKICRRNHRATCAIVCHVCQCGGPLHGSARNQSRRLAIPLSQSGEQRYRVSPLELEFQSLRACVRSQSGPPAFPVCIQDISAN